MFLYTLLDFRFAVTSTHILSHALSKIAHYSCKSDPAEHILTHTPTYTYTHTHPHPHTHTPTSTLQHRGQSDVILLDFSKAFDTVPHLRLSAKLSYYGIRGPTLSWIDSFLSGRIQSVSVNGTHSSWENVTSGVPQGSVLGPALFLIYINDILEKIQSKMKLFADDSIVYREILSVDDHYILQRDLDLLADWSSKWLMHFNIKKCAVLSITRKRNPSLHHYTIFGESLERVDEHDYLGVRISHDLRWGSHCQKIIQKASRTLGLLRRTLSPCKQEVKIKAYQAIIRPQLEYAAETWNPHTLDGIKRLEQVQRASARFVFRDYRRTTSVTQLITTLGWDSLHVRHLLSQSTMFYKIHHGLVNIQFPPVIHPSSYFGRHDHQLKYHLPDASVDSYKFSFYPRSVKIWNQLPAVAVSSPSTTAFREAALPAIRELRPPAGGSRLL